jgi:hypothetical protein
MKSTLHKIYFLSLLLFFALTHACAQFTEGNALAQNWSKPSSRKFNGGLYIGAVTSQMSGDGLGGWNKLGLNAGGFVAMRINENIGLNVALGFINKGSKKPADTKNGDTFVYIFRLNYIEMPLLLVFTPTDFIRVKAGPSAGLLIKQKTWDNNTSSELDITPAFNTLDIGGVLGIEVKLSESLSAEVRTTTSIVPVRDAPVVANKNSYYEQGNYNQTLQLLMHMRF